MKQEFEAGNLKAMQQTDLGWNSFFERHFEPYRDGHYSALRITRENREQYVACNEAGEFSCEITGKFRFEHDGKSEFPTVGDWVAATLNPHEQKALIHAVLPRQSVFSRKAVGEVTEEQPVAANVDTIFIIVGLDENFNLRRIERYLSLAWESGARPVILLNKADLCAEADQRRHEVQAIADGVDVHTLSAVTRSNTEILRSYLQKGKTIAFLGSSGVGKSTLINLLLDEEILQTNAVSAAGSRGRHTTTFRELIVLPGGGMVIDTPGMRELQLWGEADGIDVAFQDISDLAKNCRFKDCSHKTEPGCALREALESGALDRQRFESYLKLRAEFAFLADRRSMKASAVEKNRWKAISKYAKTLKKDPHRE